MSIFRFFARLFALFAFFIPFVANSAIPGAHYLNLSVGWIGSSSNLSNTTLYPTHDSGFFDSRAPLGQDVDTDSNGLMAFIGYETAVTPCWLLGAEFGYKYLGKMGYKGVYANFGEDPPEPIDDQDFSHQYKSYVVDMLFSGRYVTQSGFNVFAKLGIARLDTEQKIKSLHEFWNGTIHDTSNVSTIEKYDTVNYRPETVIGAGWSPNDHINIYIAFGRIAGSLGSIFRLDDNSSKSAQYSNESGHYWRQRIILKEPKKLTFTTAMAGISLII